MALLEDLHDHLTATLSPEALEVLLPAMTFEEVPGGIRAEAINSTWLAVWHELASPSTQEWLSRQPLTPSLTAVARAGTAVAREIRQTFTDFIADPGNQLALAACHRVVEAPGIDHNPLFLHGGPGTGKSHLLAAIADEYVEMLGDHAVIQLDGPTFVTTHALELARREASPLRSALAGAACIMLDGMDALAGRDLAQEELFHVLNDAMDRGAQVVIAGRTPPGRLQPCSERLSSRLSWGLVIGIEPAHLETRMAVILRRGGNAAQAMTSAALVSLIEARAPDMHQAVALADHLAQHGEFPQTGVVGFDRILATVADRCQLRPGDLTGKRRDRETSVARGLALLLGRRLTDHSLQALGGMVGGRDHATVLHSLRTTEERIATDPAIRQLYEELARSVVT